MTHAGCALMYSVGCYIVAQIHVSGVSTRVASTCTCDV